MAKKRPRIKQADTDIDLTPMIDATMQLIIFFILAGRISSEFRTNQIFVPPTLTAQKIKLDDWQHHVIEVWGKGQGKKSGAGHVPVCQIKLNAGQPWTQYYEAGSPNNYSALKALRAELDQLWEKDGRKFADPNNPTLMLPKQVLEIRADAMTEYRVIQEIMQVATDTIDPNNNMQAKAAATRPFVQIQFTTRKPGESAGAP